DRGRAGHADDDPAGERSGPAGIEGRYEPTGQGRGQEKPGGDQEGRDRAGSGEGASDDQSRNQGYRSSGRGAQGIRPDDGGSRRDPRCGRHIHPRGDAPRQGFQGRAGRADGGRRPPARAEQPVAHPGAGERHAGGAQRRGSGLRDRTSEKAPTRIQEEAVLKDIADLAERYSVTVRTALHAKAEADTAILKRASSGFGLIVMGVSRRPGEQLFFGNTASTLLKTWKGAILFVAS